MRVTTTILSEVEKIDFGEGKIKMVFETESQTGKPRTVIYWGNNSAQKGDTVQLTGFLKDNRFIAKSMLITRKSVQVSDSETGLANDLQSDCEA